MDATQNTKIDGGKTGSAPRSTDPRSSGLNCLRAFYPDNPINLRASSTLDPSTHGNRNAYPNRSDSPATTGLSRLCSQARTGSGTITLYDPTPGAYESK